MFHRPHFRSESEISSFQSEADRGTPPMLRSPATDSTRSSPSPNIRSSPLAAPQEDDLITPTARQHTSPSPAAWRGSYYSASNIPVPSPYPGQEPPMSSVSQQPLTSHQSQPSTTLQIPALRNRPTQPQRSPEAYEMSVREPPDDLVTPTAYRPQAPTQPSYATAYEAAYDDVVDIGPHSAQPPDDHRLSAVDPEESWRNSVYSTASGPTVL